MRHRLTRFAAVRLRQKKKAPRSRGVIRGSKNPPRRDAPGRVPAQGGKRETSPSEAVTAGGDQEFRVAPPFDNPDSTDPTTMSPIR